MPPDDNASNDVLDVALRLQDVCREHAWRFCFIGGLAVQKWSEPRVTDDVDLTIFTGFGTEAPFVDALLALDWVEPRIPEARGFALTRRVLLLQTKGGVGIDVALGAFAFEDDAIRRGLEVTLLPDSALRLCTAEDLIVFKAFAARPQDWRDVEMTIVRQGDETLDWTYVHRQLRPLLELKETPEVLEQLEGLRDRLRRAKC